MIDRTWPDRATPGLTPCTRDSAAGENARWLANHEQQPSEAAPRTLPRAGDRIRWLGRLWRVNWAHRGLISIVSDEQPERELIKDDGADGPFEVLPS